MPGDRDYRKSSTPSKGLWWFLLSVVGLAVVFYSAIQTRAVDLSFQDLAEYERRRVSFAGAQNIKSTVYIVEVTSGGTQDVLFSLGVRNWARLAHDIDLVALIYTDAASFLSFADIHQVASNLSSKATSAAPSSVVSRAVDALTHSATPGYGVVVFECGCLVPNVYFKHTDARFGGAECLLLPGFIFDEEAVHWMVGDAAPELPRCEEKRESAMRDNDGLKYWRTEVASVRREMDRMKNVARRQRTVVRGS